ncbi:transcriptional regulator [Actinomyces procaprae]|uniref:transcriptional regulator n=1 Tax=Actinomyces procaprae TaxID=2560010 RepID=UPI0010A22B3F|nr:transcriptional regulator [Actinomyces procaprae]
MADIATGRVRFRDVEPYDVPDSLDELRGPATGPVQLPAGVRWVSGDRTYDVGREYTGRLVYQAVLAEGLVDEQRRFLNRGRTIELWPVLNLDKRIVQLWEGRFPELHGRARQW